MTDKIDTGGYVYPMVNSEGLPGVETSIGGDKFATGITRRDYYAGLAMQGLVSGFSNSGEDSSINLPGLAISSYKIADALILEGKKEKGDL